GAAGSTSTCRREPPPVEYLAAFSSSSWTVTAMRLVSWASRINRPRCTSRKRRTAVTLSSRGLNDRSTECVSLVTMLLDGEDAAAEGDERGEAAHLPVGLGLLQEADRVLALGRTLLHASQPRDQRFEARRVHEHELAKIDHHLFDAGRD